MPKPPLHLRRNFLQKANSEERAPMHVPTCASDSLRAPERPSTRPSDAERVINNLLPHAVVEILEPIRE